MSDIPILLFPNLLPNSESEPRSLVAQLRFRIPDLDTAYTICPVPRCTLPLLPLFVCMQHLNDEHRWTRERIADWLESTADEFGLDLTFPVPEEE